MIFFWFQVAQLGGQALPGQAKVTQAQVGGHPKVGGNPKAGGQGSLPPSQVTQVSGKKRTWGPAFGRMGVLNPQFKAHAGQAHGQVGGQAQASKVEGCHNVGGHPQVGGHLQAQVGGLAQVGGQSLHPAEVTQVGGPSRMYKPSKLSRKGYRLSQSHAHDEGCHAQDVQVDSGMYL